jgi:hypothetical protein
MPLPSLGVTDHQRAETDHFVSDLFRAHGPALLRLALLLVGDQPSAEDVVQEAFIGLHKASLRNPDKALPYLRVAVVNGTGPCTGRLKRAATLRPQQTPVWSAEAAAIVNGTGVKSSPQLPGCPPPAREWPTRTTWTCRNPRSQRR